MSPEGGRHRNRVAVALLCLATANTTVLRTVFSPVQEMAKLDLRLSDFQVSLIQGLAVAIPIGLLSVPVGRLVDRVNRVRLLVLLILVCLLGTALTAFARGIATIFVGRMLLGFGQISSLPVAISIAADLSEPDRRGRALLALSLGVYGGAAIAFAVAGWLSVALTTARFAWLAPAHLHPWRAVHVVVGLASAVSLLTLFWLREPARTELGATAHSTVGPALRELWKRRRFLIPLFIGQVSVMMADTAANIWASPVLVRNYGLQPAQFGGWMGLVVLASGALGTVVGGYVADLGHRLPFRGGIIGGAMLAAAIAVPAAFFPVMPSVGGFGAMFGIFQFCGAAIGLGTATAIAVLLPNELRGVALSGIFVLSSIVAFGVTPTLVTLLSTALGGDAYLARSLSLTGVAIGAISLLAFILAMTQAPRRPS